MRQTYSIATDASRQLIRLTFVGQWEPAMVGAYRRDLDHALAAMLAEGGRPGSYHTLVDLREQAVQSRETAADFQAIIAAYSPLSRRTAILMSGSALHRMQIMRISGDAGRAFFTTEEEAMAWLFEHASVVP